MRLLTILEGLGVGAALMYALDPDKGAHRRNALEDRLSATWNRKREAAVVMAHDLRNRTGGLVAETRRKMRHAAPTDGELYARVRVVLGHIGTHPEAVGVVVSDGVVRLTGHAMVTDAAEIAHRIREIPGVKWIQNELRVHASPAGVPSLQGRGVQVERWTPSQAALMGLGGLTLAVFGLARRNALGTVVGLVGGALVAKAFADTESRMRPSTQRSSGAPDDRFAEHAGLA